MTFWDFIPHARGDHMVLWAMSDRAILRPSAVMEDLRVHTFQLRERTGEATFVKFHWRPNGRACSRSPGTRRSKQRSRPGLSPP